ncbi:MAG: proton-conducting transporter membrane subunit, partial [Pseudomonadota bacterium]|nr:proton-conducting transporter membrane subunit [Pseudomonadota bacterium]
AYSTMSQLGYMFFAIGVSAYGAAIFHLMTHAFFKALLFLGAGSVIHAMSDEQDMRKMGGIWKEIPYTYVMMWIGSLALAGMPFFAGYFSKDIILEAAFAADSKVGMFAFWMGIAAALMTAFYSWRLILMTFHGKPRASKKVMDHLHESPSVMISPLVVLATGALFAGYVFYGGFVGSAHHDTDVHHEVTALGDSHVEEEPVDTFKWDKEHFWGEAIKVLPENDTVEAAHSVPFWVKKLPIVVGLVGIFFAYVVYLWREGLAVKIAAAFAPLHRLFFNKWYFDELYDRIFVTKAWSLGRFFSVRGDRKTIDGFGPDGISSLSMRMGGVFSKFQSGFLFQYAFIMIIGLFALVTWLMYRITLGGY